MRMTALMDDSDELPLVSSQSLGWKDIQFSHWVDVKPQGVSCELLINHLIVVNASPRPVAVIKLIEGKRERRSAMPGETTVLPAGEYSGYGWEKPLSSFHIEMTPDFLQKVAMEMDAPHGDHLTIASAFDRRDSRLLQMAGWLSDEARDGGPGSGMYIDSLAHLVAVHLLRYYSSRSTVQLPSHGKMTNAQIARAIEYLHENMETDVRLADLSRAVNVCASYLTRLFKKATGSTPHHYLIRMRVERAKQLLLSTNETIAEVAARVGFSDQSHLNRHFKRIFGVTPKSLVRMK